MLFSNLKITIRINISKLLHIWIRIYIITQSIYSFLF
nr:MAG TPA: hypothetical protein [Caudoviricetes sp.]